MEEAEFLCDRIIILDAGKIIALGTLDELLSLQQSTEIIEFTIETPVTDGFDLDHLTEILEINWIEKEHKAMLQVQNTVEFLPKLLLHFKEKNIVLKTIVCRRKTLDDLFTSMTGKKLSN